mmetsp:Transcript_44501/g.139511  ORF Transcript_44501/g.139511 Transcript_44501/m.139511 type:complete len:369 (+) Transcript_44501:1477-2583(+)
MSLISPRISALSASRSSILACRRLTSSRSSLASVPPLEASALSRMESWYIWMACAPNCSAEESRSSGSSACTTLSCLSLATMRCSSSAFSRRSSSTMAWASPNASAGRGGGTRWRRKISACLVSHISCRSPICRSRICSSAAKSSSSFCFACNASPTSSSLARMRAAMQSSWKSCASNISMAFRRCAASASRWHAARRCWSLWMLRRFSYSVVTPQSLEFAYSTGTTRALPPPASTCCAPACMRPPAAATAAARAVVPGPAGAVCPLPAAGRATATGSEQAGALWQKPAAWPKSVEGRPRAGDGAVPLPRVSAICTGARRVDGKAAGCGGAREELADRFSSCTGARRLVWKAAGRGSVSEGLGGRFDS